MKRNRTIGLAICAVLFGTAFTACKKENNNQLAEAKSKTSASVKALGVNIFDYAYFYPTDNWMPSIPGMGGLPNPGGVVVAVAHKIQVIPTCTQAQCTTTYNSYKFWLRENNSNTLTGPYTPVLKSAPSQIWGGNVTVYEANVNFPLSWDKTFTVYMIEPSFTSGSFQNMLSYSYWGVGATYNQKF